jgi:uncharacterized membrane protein
MIAVTGLVFALTIVRAGGEAFVPRLAVSGSLVLGLASVGVLIYFIHHLAHSIQIDTIMSTIERRPAGSSTISTPTGPGTWSWRSCPDPPASAVVAPAGRSGYIQAVQPDSLVRAAARHDLVVWLARQVGDHVVEGTPLSSCWGRGDRVGGLAKGGESLLPDAVQVGAQGGHAVGVEPVDAAGALGSADNQAAVLEHAEVLTPPIG